jgi:hypothetical protein
MANVMASATEAEFSALFHNARDAIPLRTALIEMGHPQPATPIQTDNTCAAGISNKTVNIADPKQSTCDSIGFMTESSKVNS